MINLVGIFALDQWINLASMLGGTIVGGVLSMYGSILVQKRTDKTRLAEEEKRNNELASIRVLSAYLKLFQIRVWLVALTNILNASLGSTSNAEPDHLNPGRTIGTIEGHSVQVEGFSVEELALALRCNDQGVSPRLLSVQLEYRAIHEAVQKFSDKRENYFRFEIEQAISRNSSDLITDEISFPTPQAQHAGRIISDLNARIVDIWKRSNVTLAEANETFDLFLVEMKKVPGIVIPKSIIGEVQ